MAKKNVLILEDNKVMLECLTHLVSEAAQDVKVFATDNVADAYAYAAEQTIDVFMTDIILEPNKPEDTSGLEFVESIRQMEHYFFAPVIMITSLDSQRMYSYEELHCFGYITKPFEPKKIKELLQQALKFPGNSKEKKKLHFRKNGIVIPVECESIVYVECIHHVLYIHMKSREILEVPYITLKQFLIDAEGTGLIQCNRNTVINTDYVGNIDFVNRYITLKDDYGKVELGMTFKKYLKDIFKIL